MSVALIPANATPDGFSMRLSRARAGFFPRGRSHPARAGPQASISNRNPCKNFARRAYAAVLVANRSRPPQVARPPRRLATETGIKPAQRPVLRRFRLLIDCRSRLRPHASQYGHLTAGTGGRDALLGRRHGR